MHAGSSDLSPRKSFQHGSSVHPNPHPAKNKKKLSNPCPAVCKMHVFAPKFGIKRSGALGSPLFQSDLSIINEGTFYGCVTYWSATCTRVNAVGFFCTHPLRPVLAGRTQGNAGAVMFLWTLARTPRRFCACQLSSLVCSRCTGRSRAVLRHLRSLLTVLLRVMSLPFCEPVQQSADCDTTSTRLCVVSM